MSVTADAGDVAYLRRALALARDNVAKRAGGPFGAVVVSQGQVLGEGTNDVVASCDPTAHAEIVALRAAARTAGDFNLAGSVLYASCAPCPMCLAAAYWARVNRVCYAADHDQAAAAGFDDAALYREIAAAPEARSLPMTRQLADEGWQPLAAWLADPDAMPY